jgi:hypothetical protein
VIAVVYYPDVWYDVYELSFWGTLSWVVAMLVMFYYVLKWRKNTEKFYKALKEWEELQKQQGGGSS